MSWNWSTPPGLESQYQEEEYYAAHPGEKPPNFLNIPHPALFVLAVIALPIGGALVVGIFVFAILGVLKLFHL